jgi:hypothetical protein
MQIMHKTVVLFLLPLDTGSWHASIDASDLNSYRIEIYRIDPTGHFALKVVFMHIWWYCALRCAP